MTREPHFVRFAQALALVTGLAGCGGGTTVSVDSGNGGGDDAAVVADTGAGEDAATEETDAAMDEPDAFAEEPDATVADSDSGVVDCSMCICFGDPTVDAGMPSCESLGAEIPCCAAVGPLAPPDLAV